MISKNSCETNGLIKWSSIILTETLFENWCWFLFTIILGAISTDHMVIVLKVYHKVTEKCMPSSVKNISDTNFLACI